MEVMMKLLNLKNILCSLALALCSVNCATAVTLDEITSENIVTLKHVDVYNIFSQLTDSAKINAARQIAKSITKETIAKISSNIIYCLLEVDSSLSRQFMMLIDESNFYNIDKELLVSWAYQDEFKNKLEKMILQKIMAIGFSDHALLDLLLFAPLKIFKLLDLMIKFNIFPEQDNQSKKQQSYQHVDFVKFPRDGSIDKHNLNKIFMVMDQHPEICWILSEILKQEKLEQDKGRYTAIHTQDNYRWVESVVFKRVLEIALNEELPQWFYPLRFCKLGTFLSDEYRCEILEQGGIREISKMLLFMNPALMSNSFCSGNPGSSSLHLFTRNDDFALGCSLKYLFKVYDFEKYYDHYEKEFIELDKEASAGKFSTILLLSFSPDQLERSVYSGQGGGWMRKIKIHNEETANVKKILDALRNTPELIHTHDFDAIELCMILCDDPQTGVIHPFSKDPVHVYWYRVKDMSDWLKRLDALFVKIKQDIERDKQVKMQPQILQNKTSATLNSNLNPIAQHRLAVLSKQIQMHK